MNDQSDDLLVRLKKSKILLAFTVIFLVGILAIILNLGEERKWFHLPGILPVVPWLAIGEACVTAVLVGLVYERFVRQESEGHLERALMVALENQNEAMVSAMTAAVALSSESLTRLNSNELEAAFARMLAVKLGDETLAEEVIKGIVPQAVGSVDRYIDFRCRTRLLPDTELGPRSIRYMTARVTVSYRRKLKSTAIRFGLCGDGADIYGRLDSGMPWDVLWSPGRMIHYQMTDPRVFEIEYVQVNDVVLDVQQVPEDQMSHGVLVGYEASSDLLEGMLGHEVEVEYCYSAKIPKLGHIMAFPVTQACKGVSFEFDLGDVGIDRATLWPFFVTANSPKVMANEVGSRKVLSAKTTRWVLAGGGIALVWRLSGESDERFFAADEEVEQRLERVPGDQIVNE